MAPAIEELKKIAFYKLDITRIEIDIANCNVKSIKVACKIGAKAEKDIPVGGGCKIEGKKYKGKKYVLKKPNSNTRGSN